jgi:hypothetical protein
MSSLQLSRPKAHQGAVPDRRPRVPSPRTAQPTHSLAGTVMDLQRKAGNSATAALLAAGQAKLAVSPAGDRYEREADAIATEVVARLRSGPARQGTSPAEDEASAAVAVMASRKLPAGPAPLGPEGGELAAAEESRIHAARQGGTPLPRAVRRAMEGAFGADFSGVRLHTGAEAESLSGSVGAIAFTVGHDIFLGRAAPQLSSTSGQSLLAHELAHTIQQGAAHVPGQDGSQGGVRRLMVQRDVGFEFQTGWGIRERFPYRAYNRQETIRDYGLFKLTADEANTPLGAEIEFVVNHVPEDQPARMRTALEYLENLAREMNKFKDSFMFKLSDATKVAADDKVEVHPTVKQHGEMMANPQVTGGVRLDKMTTMFKDLSKPSGQHSTAQHELVATGGGPGLGAAADKVANLKVNGQDASDKCKGLVALLVTYLMMGKKYVADRAVKMPTLNYAKASLTLLARTDFAEMFTHLPQEERDFFSRHPAEFEQLVLDAEGTNLNPKRRVLERGVHNERVGPTRRAWLLGIAGGNDLMKKSTDERLFGYGELGNKKDDVGPGRAEPGEILEFRTMGKSVPWDEWLPMGERIFAYIADLNR